MEIVFFATNFSVCFRAASICCEVIPYFVSSHSQSLVSSRSSTMSRSAVARLGFVKGEALVGARMMPAIMAASLSDKSAALFPKYTLHAISIPYTPLPK